ncbi:MAG TPA: response regulator [Opitutaceae bacterium]|nr:response regulator [Opitutaceae bacterium]
MSKPILIVDDEAAIRELLGEYLGGQGYRIAAFASAAEAERAALSEAPRLIISDLQLEESDGLEMIARLKSALPDTPIILLTGVLFDPEVVRTTLSQKVSCYLEKTSSLGRSLEEVKRLAGPP